ncbi:hypothetical protein GUJ93_ZPchr0006g45227 [Zizania palustris]|uniref:H15 domain-containing protein n=1 Tax=Zizania palustris TaxID=103762 RepID=A0A8J5SI88_ZIZPA|nr:hypothetical protein GUJ93_ZPchr0006g45227 [Zizania palustris]
MATATEEVAAVAAGEAPPATEKFAESKDSVEVEAKAEVKKADEEVKKVEGTGETEKAKKERKAKTRKPRSAGLHHPPYFEMIKEAIMALDSNGKPGSSSYAIAKYMGEKHKEVLPVNYRKVLAVQLRNFAAKGRLVKVKASFKLSAAEEKAAAAKAKAAKGAKRKRTPRPASKKPASSAAAAAAANETKKAVPPARPARAKRARKAAPAKPMQTPKSIRSAISKKANKASA